MKHIQQGFTLIELLIVVAIIAILAAIAVPNFLEAQTRAKTARVKADMRSMSTALETYVVDYNTYVYQNKLSRAVAMQGVNTPTLERLTTPISYLTGITAFVSPFKSAGWFAGADFTNKSTYNAGQKDLSQIYWYNARNAGNDNGDGAAIWGRDDPKPTWYFTHSAGPAGFAYATNGGFNAMTNETDANKTIALSILYDASNGTVSPGGIFRVGGVPTDPGAVFYKVAQGQN